MRLASTVCAVAFLSCGAPGVRSVTVPVSESTTQSSVSVQPDMVVITIVWDTTALQWPVVDWGERNAPPITWSIRARGLRELLVFPLSLRDTAARDVRSLFQVPGVAVCPHQRPVHDVTVCAPVTATVSTEGAVVRIAVSDRAVTREWNSKRPPVAMFAQRRLGGNARGDSVAVRIVP
jgi:hypothetical protein